MLSRKQVDEVARLLGEGLSSREIARRTGVSRGTIGNIASGKRDLRAREDAPCLRATKMPNPGGGGPAPPHRCPRCLGIITTAECLLCATRDWMREHGELPERRLDVASRERSAAAAADRELISAMRALGPE